MTAQKNPKAKASMLIVEDDAVLLKTLADEFIDGGFEVFTATNGQRGLQLAREHLPDIILLDILLPQKSGIEVLKALRTDGAWGRKVSIIMLTNLSADDAIMSSISKYEPSFYIIKENFQLQELVEKVNSCLGKE